MLDNSIFPVCDVCFHNPCVYNCPENVHDSSIKCSLCGDMISADSEYYAMGKLSYHMSCFEELTPMEIADELHLDKYVFCGTDYEKCVYCDNFINSGDYVIAGENFISHSDCFEDVLASEIIDLISLGTFVADGL